METRQDGASAAGPREARDIWMLEVRGILDPRYWADKEEDAQEYIRERAWLIQERPRIVHLREVVQESQPAPLPTDPCMGCGNPAGGFRFPLPAEAGRCSYCNRTLPPAPAPAAQGEAGTVLAEWCSDPAKRPFVKQLENALWPLVADITHLSKDEEADPAVERAMEAILTSWDALAHPPASSQGMREAVTPGELDAIGEVIELAAKADASTNYHPEVIDAARAVLADLRAALSRSQEAGGHRVSLPYSTHCQVQSALVIAKDLDKSGMVSRTLDLLREEAVYHPDAPEAPAKEGGDRG